MEPIYLVETKPNLVSIFLVPEKGCAEGAQGERGRDVASLDGLVDHFVSPSAVPLPPDLQHNLAARPCCGDTNRGYIQIWWLKICGGYIYDGLVRDPVYMYIEWHDRRQWRPS